MRDLDSGTRAAVATHVSFLQLFIGESDNKSIKKKIKGEKTESWGPFLTGHSEMVSVEVALD